MSAPQGKAPGEATLIQIAERAVEAAQKLGAKGVAAGVSRQREVSVTWRDGKLEKIQEATTRSLGIKLYVDGRYSAVSTSDLRPVALVPFLRQAVALTRALAEDPFRTLPDPTLYEGQAKVDLELVDPAYDGVTPVQRRQLVEAIEQAARAAPGAASIVSVTTDVGDSAVESHYVTSNGFRGSRRETSFSASAAVTVKDSDGRRPEDYHYGSSRRFADLVKAEELGREACRRAVGRLGAKKGASGELTILVENRAAGRLASYLFPALSGQALQQKRSFLEGKIGVQVGSALLDLTDDPLIPQGLSSRLFDGEGLAARRLPIFEQGLLRSYYLDTYYGKKLKLPPTTGRPSNMTWKLGDRGLAQLIAETKDGILVTSFLGGNSNSTTGDFSLGVAGVRVRAGKLAESVAEMNIAGNHLELWKRLVAVGNDPFPHSPLRTPTLVFAGVQVAGT